MDIEDIKYVVYYLSDIMKVDAPEIEIDNSLRKEGIRAEFCFGSDVIVTSEPENISLAIHEFAHYVYNEREEEQESDIHGPGFFSVCSEISEILASDFDICLSAKEIVEVPFGDVFID